MGQAAVDLPKTLANAPAPAAAGKAADDLLSQMAGDEIDRLLAESDAAKSGADGSAGAAAAPTAAGDPTDPLAAQLDQLFDQLNSTPADVTTVDQAVAASAAAAAAVAPPISPPAAKAATAPAPPQEKPATAAPKAEAPSAKAPASAPTKSESTAAASPAPAPALETAPEKATPHDSDAAHHTATNAVAASAVHALGGDAHGGSDDSADEKPSLLVNLLEMLNAPLMILPENLRDLVGRLAILTMMNAIGVIVYILLFRGR